ncbi:MAG: hypothetical protein GC190_19950 [Alphaproteobacteria bacterium]|nr:hypothetical protein [Alphaproteobacteria bacterium]
MFTNRQATDIVAKALETHKGPEAAQEFRQQFGRYGSDVVPPPAGTFDPFFQHAGAQITYLTHMGVPHVMDVLGQSARAGDRDALDLLINIADNRHGESAHRLDALSVLATAAPSKAYDLAVLMMHDKDVNSHLGEALIRHTRSPDLIPALTKIALSPNYEVRESAMSALVELGERGCEALVGLLFSESSEVRHTAGGALSRQKLATPLVRDAVERFSRSYPQENIHLRDTIERSGFKWTVDAVIQEARNRLNEIDERPDPMGQRSPSAPRKSFFARNFRSDPSPEAVNGIQDGLLCRHRELEGTPLTKPERVAESLVKLAVLRPQVMYELARASADAAGPNSHEYFRKIHDLEIWRPEQRDSKLFCPLAKQLASSDYFRERVRRLLDTI